MRFLNILTLTCLALAAPALANPAAERPQQAAAPAGYDPAQVLAERHADTGPLVLRLKAQHADRLAGMYSDEGRGRLTVRLIGSAPVAPETHWIDSQRIDVVFEPGAQHTFTELHALIEDSGQAIASVLPTAHARHVDERTGEIVVAIEPGSEAIEAKRGELAQRLGVPVRVEISEPAVLNTTRTAGAAAPPPADCGASALQSRLGQPVTGRDAADARVGGEPIQSLGNVRVIAPGQSYTEDYREDRLTLNLDTAGKLVRARCI